jgi:hypothetical protein
VVIAITADTIVDSFENQQSIAKRTQWLKYFRQLELASLLCRPKGGRDNAVGAEHPNHPLFAGRVTRAGETR